MSKYVAYRIKLVLALHVMLDEHDVVNGLLDGEGGGGLGRLDVARRLHDVGQAVVEAVQVALELLLA